MADDPKVRIAGEEDADLLARMQIEFNAEFDDDSAPEHEVLAERIRAHIASGEMYFLLAGDGPDGHAQVALHPTLYSAGPNAYLGELWVRPERRGEGLGRAMLDAAMEEARRRGCDHFDTTTSMGDDEARSLYESAGFINTEGGPDGPLMVYYERDL
ncbi:MAG: GNAT family N-acetyltransferase [Solirubrobacterales bacterium]